LHSPRLTSSQSGSRSGIKKILRLNIIAGIRDLIGDKFSKIHLEINKKIIKSTISNRARIIVHTLRAQRQIKDFFGFERVIVHPLKLVGADYVSNAKTFSDLVNKAGLLDDDILIGMFGYLSAYKGHTDALNALKKLPKNYKLLIFGRQHPQTLKSNGVVDPYLEHLVHIATTDKVLKNRVLFMGELNDQDFLEVVSGVDVAWLPYYENGQDGSGIASICLDLCPRVLCSSSFAFDELFKLVRYKNVMRFDIGNILEMALKTKIILGGEELEKPYGEEHKYNLKTQAEAYVNELPK
jgi:glycosyltransferase involved in cell wall biosynthesis